MNRSFRCLMHVHSDWRLYHRLSWNFSLGQVLVFLFSSLWVVDEKAPSATVDDSDLVMEQNLILEVSELRQLLVFASGVNSSFLPAVVINERRTLGPQMAFPPVCPKCHCGH